MIADYTTIEILIDRAVQLKHSIEAQTTELRSINKQLAELAEYKEGSKTGYLVGAGYKVKVQKKLNTTWDQKRLEMVRAHVGPDIFETICKTEYRPMSTALQSLQGAHAAAFSWAMSVKAGAPQISFETIEEGLQ